MQPKNCYPTLPELPYQKTSVQMPMVVVFARSLVDKYPIEVVRTAYCIFRNESANGQSGVNDNYIGLQADDAAWPGLTGILGTVVKKDSGGALRRFVAFNSDGYKVCFDFLCQKVQQRGVYIGGSTHMFTKVAVNDTTALATAYCTEWSRQPVTPANIANFKSLYNSSLTAIPG